MSVDATTTPRANSATADRLARIRPADLPTPRRAALRALEACSDPDIDARRLAVIVGADPALAAELLRVTNSAWFGFAREVSSIAHAVAILGQRALRNIVLCVSVRDVLAGEVVHGQDTAPLRDMALRRAVAARMLGERVGVAADDCFTLGLLQDLGLLAMFRACPEHLGLWQSFLAADPAERQEREREVFGIGHDDVGHALAHAWHLPDSLARAIGDHHRYQRDATPGKSDETMLCRIAWTADWIAALFEPGDERRRVRDAREALATEWGLDANEADALLGAVAEGVLEAATTLGMSTSSKRSYEQVLSEANLALAEENLGMQELNWRLERVLAERDAAAASLRDEIEKARVVQRSLLPTPRAECWPVDGFHCPFHGINAAARELSGDFFDFFPLPDGRWYFNLADVSGKGMDAALMMVKASSLFHCLGKNEHDPGRLLGLINAELCENPVRGMFVTMVAGILDPRDGGVRLVNAGHPPVLTMSASGAVDVIPAHSPPLGVLPELVFESVAHELGDGELYLFTDGLVDASSGNHEKLGYAGVVELVRRYADAPVEERLARILGAVSRSHGLSRDDVTMLLVEGKAGPGARAAAPDILDPRAI